MGVLGGIVRYPFLFLAIARALTFGRLAALPAFLWVLVGTAGGKDDASVGWLMGLYAFIAFSDLVDGPLARLAGAASRRWGWWDAVGDMAFNFFSLSVAAGLGLVGPWVPAAVAVLGGRFLWRNSSGSGPNRGGGPRR